MNTTHTVERHTVADSLRAKVAHDLFGLEFSFKVEPTIYSMADLIAPDYSGGFWEFHQLSNGGFYMAPTSEKTYRVICENGFEGELSSDALGIAACLYAYSHLSFGTGRCADECAEQYHLLRRYAMDHTEAGAIAAAID